MLGPSLTPSRAPGEGVQMQIPGPCHRNFPDSGDWGKGLEICIFCPGHPPKFRALKLTKELHRPREVIGSRPWPPPPTAPCPSGLGRRGVVLGPPQGLLSACLGGRG